MEGTLIGKSVSLRRRSVIWSSLIVGVAFLIVTAGLTVHSCILLVRGVRTTGKVVRLIPSMDSKGRVRYTPDFQYTAKSGMVYSTISNFSSNPPEYTVGQSIPVLYEPGHPETAMLDSFGALWFLPVLFGCFGIGILACGILFRHFFPPG